MNTAYPELQNKWELKVNAKAWWWIWYIMLFEWDLFLDDVFVIERKQFIV